MGPPGFVDRPEADVVPRHSSPPNGRPSTLDLVSLMTIAVSLCLDHGLVGRVGRRGAEDLAPKLTPKPMDVWRKWRTLMDEIFHHPGLPAGEIQQSLWDALAVYRATLSPAYQSLLDRYELRDVAIKVVGTAA